MTVSIVQASIQFMSNAKLSQYVVNVVILFVCLERNVPITCIPPSAVLLELAGSLYRTHL